MYDTKLMIHLEVCLCGRVYLFFFIIFPHVLFASLAQIFTLTPAKIYNFGYLEAAKTSC